MMTIEEIYKRFTIPPNLAEHMLTVTKVACSIKDNWKGGEIEWDLVLKSALLHDIGNIVKFKFDLNPEFMGDEQKNIEYWKGIQKRVVDAYGADDHIASGNMLKEIGITGKLRDTIQNKSFANTIAVAQEDDWYAKILLYADMRVMPHGIESLEKRLEDVRRRMPQYSNRPDFEEMLDAMRDIEGQLSNQLDTPIGEIDWGNVREENDELLLVNV